MIQRLHALWLGKARSLALQLGRSRGPRVTARIGQDDENRKILNVMG